MLSCDNMCFHKLSCLIMSYHGFHMLSCDNMCFFYVFLAVQPPPFGFMAVQPPLFGFMAVQPPHNSSLQCFLWLSSHHFFPPTQCSPNARQEKNHQLQRCQFLRLPWGFFPPKISHNQRWLKISKAFGV